MIMFQLVTLDGIKFGEEVHEITLPTPDGYIAVFEHHAPLVSIISPGVISVRRHPNDTDDRLEYFATAGGVVEISEDDNRVQVLVDEADQEADINEQEARTAFEKAQAMRSEATDRVSLQHAQAMVDRQASRLKVADLRRHKRH
jgi:ATP synthase F1 epsilon subunit